jgi:methylated-DNA-[protein]-cysteine S-methyltransferase
METDICYYDSPIGMFRLFAGEKGITKIQFAFGCKERINTVEAKSPLLKQAVRQLSEYFAGERKEFALQLDLQGTDFQLRTWNALCDIPYGETRSYKQIAEAIGCPKGCRAVGLANNRNPIPIIIPCHRVIGANGDLTGYAGGLEIKKRLLAIEGVSTKT